MAENRFESFAPMRKHCQVKWYSNGEGFMSDVADAIEKAKKEIYITDWMMSPHIFLKRPASGTRLSLKDLLLKKADKDNVSIFVLLFGEINVGGKKPVDVASEFAASELKHKNIRVLRHASYNPGLSGAVNLVWDMFIHGKSYWTHHEKTVVIDQTLAFVGGIDLCYGRWDTHEHPLNDNYPKPPENAEVSSRDRAGAEMTVYQRWVGKDYCNTFVRDSKHLDQPLKEILDRAKEPRLPWHDTASCVFGEPARDVAQHFIRRFNFTKHDLKGTHQDHLAKEAPVLELRNDRISKYKYLAIQDAHSNACNCQVVRSVSKWSIGDEQTETSIHSAYIHFIENAEHFIYIENQFFISSLPEAENQIVEAIRKRVIRAHKSKERLRVIIVLPQKPEFSGDFNKASGAQLASVTYWMYKTILHLYDQLEQENEYTVCLRDFVLIHPVTPEDYIGLYALQKHDRIRGLRDPVTELVYIHSKCMIVDDRVAIIGSANINERSMLGYRDSEMCVVFEDTVMIDGRMDGKRYPVGEFCHRLRCYLFREFLGLVGSDQISVEDPISDEFYHGVWKKTAEKNFDILKEVFGGKLYPNNEVKTYKELKEYRKKPGMFEKADEKLPTVQGTLVPLQFRFLETNLEKLRRPKNLLDIRHLPDSILDPIVMLRLPTDDDLDIDLDD